MAQIFCRLQFMASALGIAWLAASGSMRAARPAAGAAPPAARKVDVYVIPFSHLDRFWAGTGEETLARGNRIIAKAIALALKYPQFRFFLETDNFVNNYVHSHRGTPAVAALKQLVRKGRIAIAPEWAGIFQEFPPGEALARNLLYGEQYAQRVFGVTPRVDALSDIPGVTPQFPQMLSEAGIPFMILSRMGPRNRSLFHWRAPDGSQALVWNDLYGYCWGAQLDSPGVVGAQQRQRLAGQIARVEATAPGPLLMSSGCDLWASTAQLLANLNALNRSLPRAHFVVATPQAFFDRVASTPSLPALAGEIPSGWPMIETSILHLWQWTAPATHTLLNAEKFAAINDALGYAPYPRHSLNLLWRRLLTSMDHNHDGQGGRIGDERKLQYSQMALLGGGDILRRMLRNIAERVQIPFPGSFPVVVFNPLGWTRDGIVRAHVTLFGDVVPGQLGAFRKGVQLVDANGHAVPFQVLETSENISRALTLVFVARGVPSLGYRTYFLRPAAGATPGPAAAQVTLDQTRDRREPRRPLGVEVLQNRFYRVTVDRATGAVSVFDRALGRVVTPGMVIAAEEERGGNNVTPELLTGRTIYASVNHVRLVENDSVRTVLRIDERIADIRIVQRLTLYAQLKRLDIENRIRWRRNRLLNIEQWIPLAQPHTAFHYGVAFGENASDRVLPGAGPSAGDEIQPALWHRYREMHGWLFAGSAQWGLTLAGDHPIVALEPQMIRADMIRGQRYTSVKIDRGGRRSSMHYPWPGDYVFHYSLSSGAGGWRRNQSWRAGMALENPLLPVEVADDLSPKSLPPVNSFCSVPAPNLVISALKKAQTGNAIVLRLYEIQGLKTESPVVFLGRARAFRPADLLEQAQGPVRRRRLRLRPFQIQTLRLRP